MRVTPRQAPGALLVYKEVGRGIWTTTLTTTGEALSLMLLLARFINQITNMLEKFV